MRILLLVLIGLGQAWGAVFTPPTLSDHRLNMVGNNSTTPADGVAGFFRIAGGADGGHALGAGAVQNSPDGTRAYYYLSSIERTPTPNGGSQASHGVSLTGMANTTGFLNANAGNVANLSFSFGATGADRTRTWNLGLDQNGVNWFGSPQSNLEERKYEANAGEVDSGLYYNGARILTFAYTPFYMQLNYGPTTAPADDSIVAFSDAVGATRASGLAGFNDGLATALLTDISANGGLVQLNLSSIQPATRTDYFDANFFYGSFAFQGSLQVVPEPSQYALMLSGLTIVGATIWRRRHR